MKKKQMENARRFYVPPAPEGEREVSRRAFFVPPTVTCSDCGVSGPAQGDTVLPHHWRCPWWDRHPGVTPF